MAKTAARLTDRNCRTVGEGKHHDGMGLYLTVRSHMGCNTRSTCCRY
jgi:hypothetical protein